MGKTALGNGKITITQKAKYGMQACPNNNHVTSTHSWHWPHRKLDTLSRTYNTLDNNYYEAFVKLMKLLCCFVHLN